MAVGSAHPDVDFAEFAAAEVAKQVRRLGVPHSLLHFLDLVLNVAIGNEDIFQSGRQAFA